MDLAFYRRNAWWLVTGLLFTFGSAFGQTYFISLSAGSIRAEFGLSDGEWGGLYSIATLASAVTLIFAGRLADTMPLVRVAAGVLVLYALAALLMALATGPVMLAIAVFGLRFCGQGMMSQIAMTAMARWFRANRGRALAFAVMGYPIGEALYPMIAVGIIGALGWHAPWLGVAGLLLFVFLPLVIVLMRHGRTPQSEGSHTDGPGMEGRQWTRGEVMRHWSFWLVVPGILAPAFIGTCAIFHQVHIAEVKGYDLATMAFAYPLYAATSIGSTLLTGQLIDRYGPTRLLPFFLIPLGIGIATVAIPAGVWTWFTLLAGVAMTAGTMAPLAGALWPTLYGTHWIGSIKALAASMMVLATALGPGITGFLIDKGIDFPQQGLVLSAYCFVVTAIFLIAAPRLTAALPRDTAEPVPA